MLRTSTGESPAALAPPRARPCRSPAGGCAAESPGTTATRKAVTTSVRMCGITSGSSAFQFLLDEARELGPLAVGQLHGRALDGSRARRDPDLVRVFVVDILGHAADERPGLVPLEIVLCRPGLESVHHRPRLARRSLRGGGFNTVQHGPRCNTVQHCGARN